MKKLSELSTNELAEVLAIVTPEFGVIMTDEEIASVFNQGKQDSETAMAFGLRRIIGLIPLVLQKHKECVYKIIAAFNGKTVEEIGNQKGLETARELKALLQDEDLKSFLA